MPALNLGTYVLSQSIIPSFWTVGMAFLLPQQVVMLIFHYDVTVGLIAAVSTLLYAGRVQSCRIRNIATSYLFGLPILATPILA